MVIQQNGNVGIGTTGPVAKLDIVGAGLAIPATSGTTQSAGLIARLHDSSNLVLDIGGAGSGGIWLQATAKTDLSTNYPLLLNPNGGGVVFGTALDSTFGNKYSAVFGATGAVGNYINLGLGYYNNASPNLPPALFGFQFTATDNFMKGDLVFGTRDVTTNTNPVERMRITSSGNVGIGTTSPSQLFYVYGNLQAATGSTSTLLANTATQTVTVQNLVVNGTLNVTGQTSLANASTSNVSVSGTLYDKSNYKVVGGFTKTFWMASTTVANISNTSFGSATTTNDFFGMPYAWTLNRIACGLDSATGTLDFLVGTGSSSSTPLVVTTSSASSTPSVSFNADQKVYFQAGSEVNGADGLTCTIQGVPN